MTLDEVIAEIQEMRDENKSYGYIGNKYEVNKGIIYRMLHDGYEPKDKSIRRKLGLEDLIIDFVRQVRSAKGTFITTKNSPPKQGVSRRENRLRRQ